MIQIVLEGDDGTTVTSATTGLVAETGLQILPAGTALLAEGAAPMPGQASVTEDGSTITYIQVGAGAEEQTLLIDGERIKLDGNVVAAANIQDAEMVAASSEEVAEAEAGNDGTKIISVAESMDSEDNFLFHVHFPQ